MSEQFFPPRGGKLSDKTDDALVADVREGDEKAFNELIHRYTPTVSSLSHSYFSDALTPDDWFQEGMLGLFFAVFSFREDSGATFASFASVCVRNRLNSAWKNANSKKNEPLNRSLSLDDSHVPAVSSAEEAYIESEQSRFLTEDFLQELSPAEQRVFRCYLSGYSYAETADKLDISEKAVDNALCRVKAKLKKAFQS